MITSTTPDLPKALGSTVRLWLYCPCLSRDKTLRSPLQKSHAISVLPMRFTPATFFGRFADWSDFSSSTCSSSLGSFRRLPFLALGFLRTLRLPDRSVPTCCVDSTSDTGRGGSASDSLVSKPIDASSPGAACRPELPIMLDTSCGGSYGPTPC